MSSINGRGCLCLTKHLFTPMKSVRNQTVASFFGIVKHGTAHYEVFTFFSRPMISNLLTSFLAVASNALRTVYARAYNGLDPSTISSYIGFPFQAPLVPWKASTFSLSKIFSLSLFQVSNAPTSRQLLQPQFFNIWYLEFQLGWSLQPCRFYILRGIPLSFVHSSVLKELFEFPHYPIQKFYSCRER